MAEDKKAALISAINSLADSFTAEAREAESYKELFKKFGDNDFRGLLRDMEHKMMGIVLDGMQVIQDKTGIHPTHDIWHILLALPYLCVTLEKRITEVHGHSCCVDKTYHTLAKIIQRDLQEKATNKPDNAIKGEG